MPMSAADLLKKLPSAFNADAASGVDATMQFNCSTPVNIVIKNGSCTANDGTAGNADVTVTMEDDDLVALMKGELNGMTAFMTGKLQIEGDLMLAQRMFGFFDASKLS
jgi:putative sterol carrier protein